MIARTYVAPGSDTSREAAIRAQRFAGPQAVDVYQFIGWNPIFGVTQKEVSDVLGISRQSCCARFRALEQGGYIRKTSLRRDGCTAYVVVCGDAPTQLELLEEA